MNSCDFLHPHREISDDDSTTDSDDDSHPPTSDSSISIPDSDTDSTTHSDTPPSSSSSPSPINWSDHSQLSMSQPNVSSTITESPVTTRRLSHPHVRPVGPRFLDIYYVKHEPPVNQNQPRPRTFHRPPTPSSMRPQTLTRTEYSLVVHQIRQARLVVTPELVHTYAMRLIPRYRHNQGLDPTS